MKLIRLPRVAQVFNRSPLPIYKELLLNSLSETDLLSISGALLNFRPRNTVRPASNPGFLRHRADSADRDGHRNATKRTGQSCMLRLQDDRRGSRVVATNSLSG